MPWYCRSGLAMGTWARRETPGRCHLSRRLPRKGRAIWLVTVGALAGTAAWSTWNRGEAGAISAMGEGKRRALFSREEATFYELCHTALADGRLLDRCRERADFITAFPDCDS